MRKDCLIILVLILIFSNFHAYGFQNTPILKIETEMHTASINKILVDRDEKYIITASSDKTIKIWDLKNLSLLRTLRPPIGNQNEGVIRSLAISPDGMYLAAGGNTKFTNEDNYLVFIFNFYTGEITHTIKHLPNSISSLSYSKDGKYLAVGMHGNEGIVIYDTQNGYNRVFVDKDYSGSVSDLDFSMNGQLVAGSYDRYIRLYDNDFKLLVKKKPISEGEPHSVRFSPNGDRIAVGFNGSNKIDVLQSKDLSYLYSPDSSYLNKYGLYTVAWSHDSNFLYAGGKSSTGGKSFPIRKWTAGGRGNFRDLPAAYNTIFQIVPLKNGDILYCSFEPSFGVFDKNDNKVFSKEPEVFDFRGKSENFLISDDGFTIHFSTDPYDNSFLTFSIHEKLLKKAGFFDAFKLNKPKTTAFGINITDWQNSENPKLNGKPLPLSNREVSRSVAISPDNKGFLMGTNWSLRYFDKNGRIIWSTPLPTVVWQVNISKDAKLGVAFLGDGTIRWFGMEDGRELLTLFVHKDKKRWVLWTPKGYYNSSPGGESLIGWHINNGIDKTASFYPVSKFREKFYKPEIAYHVLTFRDEAKAIAALSPNLDTKSEPDIEKILPPSITILYPLDGSNVKDKELTVKFSLKNPSKDPIQSIKVLIDGRPISQFRGISLVEKQSIPGETVLQELKITVPERDFELTLLAENRNSTSEPSTVRLKWDGKKEEFIVKPNLYILSIGVSNYNDQSLKLTYAHKDADDFVKHMINQKGKIYNDVKVKLLLNEKATKDEILDGLDWIQKEATHKDVAIIFLAGHGVTDHNNFYYFLPQNADLEKLKRTGIPYSDIKNTVSSIAGKVVMFVDTCHSGGVMGKRGSTDITNIINDLTSAENGVVVFASSTGRQFSYEDPSWGNGAFTKAILEGVNGKADFLGKGKITINMLDAYIAERVKELTTGKQTPVTMKPNTVPDFPIAVK